MSESFLTKSVSVGRKSGSPRVATLYNTAATIESETLCAGVGWTAGELLVFDRACCAQPKMMIRSRLILNIPRTLPNGSRLSCGALMKDSVLNLRAPAASSAC